MYHGPEGPLRTTFPALVEHGFDGLALVTSSSSCYMQLLRSSLSRMRSKIIVAVSWILVAEQWSAVDAFSTTSSILFLTGGRAR